MRTACVAVGGCVNGPVRYGALGSARFAAVEFARDADAPLVAPAALGGLIVDAGVVAGDTVAFVVDAVFLCPVEIVESAFEERAPWWRTCALPVTVPVGSPLMAVYDAIHPANVAAALGFSEGPYGDGPRRETQRRATDDATPSPQR
jgi:hypothetical protein